MKLIHSVWTKPMIENRWEITGQLSNNLWLFAYSILHAKKHCKKITLHTDELGAELYGDLGYNEVKLTLNQLKDMNMRFWAMGKMLAIESEPIGSIHIDGDVFLKKRKMVEVMNLKHHDLIVQGEERLGIFMQHYFDTLHHYPIGLSKMPEGFDMSLKHSLNCGVLGFNDQELKNEYLTGFYSMVEQLSTSEYFLHELYINPKFEPNIVIEQFFLAGLCKKNQSKVKHVLPLTSDSNDIDGTVKQMNDTANRIGYAHAWGSTKYDLIPAIKEIIKHRDSRLFKKVSKKIASISKL